MRSMTYLITDITAHPPVVSVRVLSEDGDGILLRLTEEKWEEFGLSRGEEITEDVFSRIRLESEKCEAVTKALSVVSASTVCLKGLERKMFLAGFSEEAVRYAVDITVKKGYIDEYADAARIAENEALKKRRGPVRIKRELMAKGYGASVASEAASSVSREIYAEALEKELAKRCPDGVPESRYEREKLAAALMRQGFTSAAVLKAIERSNKY